MNQPTAQAVPAGRTLAQRTGLTVNRQVENRPAGNQINQPQAGTIPNASIVQPNLPTPSAPNNPPAGQGRTKRLKKKIRRTRRRKSMRLRRK